MPRDPLRGSAGLTHVPQQQQPLSWMPSEAYDNFGMDPLQVSVMCLLCIMVFPFCFQVLMWLPCSPMGTQPLGFATSQPFGAYHWQAYMSPDDSLGPTLGIHQVAAPLTAFSWGSLLLLISLSPQLFQKYTGENSFEGLA